MPYKISSDKKRGCIVEMREGGMKSLDIVFVLNVPLRTVSTILNKFEGPRECKIFEIPMW